MPERAAAWLRLATRALLPRPEQANKTVRVRCGTHSTASPARDRRAGQALPAIPPYRRLAKAVRVGILRSSNLSSEAPNGAQQFFTRKRFCNVAVCALLLAPIFVAGGVLARHQNHGNHVELAAALEFAANLKAIAVWHHHVEQNHAWPFVSDGFLNATRITHADRLIAFRLQQPLHQLHLSW